MEGRELQELWFVYNADSGLGNTLLDGAHKVLSPATYACKLCQLTHGAFTERKAWKDFRQSHTLPMHFLHKDEFRKEFASKYGHAYNFPVVLGNTGSELEVVVSRDELNALKTVSDLILLLQTRT